MVKLVPARLENGQVIALEPLPKSSEVQSVAILLEVKEQAAPDPSRLVKWFGLLKDYTGDAKADYRKHLEEKYL